jgi:hypothetical protein
MMKRLNGFWGLTFVFLFVLFGGIEEVDGRSALGGTIYNGNPGNYRDLLDILVAGDTLLLAAGTYTEGLPIYDMNGTAGAPITIAGPESGARAVFLANPCICYNTVEIQDSSYIQIHNLELDGQNLANVDAVKASGNQNVNWAHHITLENLYIHDHAPNQQTVGISTKIPAWDWVIRRNIIDMAGTGLYLGNSDGNAPFIRGLIEGNLVVDTMGYNMQIKHQNGRPNIPGIPTGDNQTIIRHNVFSKANNASTGDDARPNLLVGHWPLSGTGSNDVYLIYGNFFFENPTAEPLFQGTGNIALYDNLFVSTDGDAAAFQPHEGGNPRLVRAFNNTVVSAGTGIRVTGGEGGYQQNVIGNAVFGATPLQGGSQSQNVTGAYGNADDYLTNPYAAPGLLDLYPLPGTLTGSPLDSSSFNTFTDWNQDFNFATHDGTFRGAYAGEGQNPGWLPQLARKPLGPPVAFSEFVFLSAIFN